MLALADGGKFYIPGVQQLSQYHTHQPFPVDSIGSLKLSFLPVHGGYELAYAMSSLDEIRFFAQSLPTVHGCAAEFVEKYDPDVTDSRNLWALL